MGIGNILELVWQQCWKSLPNSLLPQNEGQASQWVLCVWPLFTLPTELPLYLVDLLLGLLGHCTDPGFLLLCLGSGMPLGLQ